MSAIQIYIAQEEKFAFCGDIHFDSVTPSSRIDNYMETCCRKVEAMGDICVAEGVRYLFFAGDIFNRVQCTHECVNRAGQALLSLKNKGIRLFSICGNHDLPRDSLQRLGQSPVETLFRFGVLEHVSADRPVEIYNKEDPSQRCKITPCDYTETIPLADKSFPANILLAHMFFNKTGFMGGDDQNITADKMEACGYDLAFLGHDHEEYPPVLCGKTLVVRSGSLLRGTAHNYNFTREPGFVIVDNIFFPGMVHKKVVPHHPYQDIVSQAALSRKQDVVKDEVDRQALHGLAMKLSEAKQEGDTKDVILEMIKSDPAISDSCRKILLGYIARQG